MVNSSVVMMDRSAMVLVVILTGYWGWPQQDANKHPQNQARKQPEKRIQAIHHISSSLHVFICGSAE